MPSKTLLAPMAALAAVLVAGPALAGPAGVGLGLTEEVARRNFEERRTVKVAVAGAACASRAKAAAEAHPAVTRASHDGAALKVLFRSTSAAAEHAGAVQTAVSQACA